MQVIADPPEIGHQPIQLAGDGLRSRIPLEGPTAPGQPSPGPVGVCCGSAIHDQIASTQHVPSRTSRPQPSQWMTYR
jgi:hypothetical protein